MKKLHYGILLFILTFVLTACSPINSIQPFDECQANILIMNASSIRPAREMISIQLPDRRQWKQIIKPKNFPSVQIMLVYGNDNHLYFREAFQTKIKSRYTFNPPTLQSFAKEEFACSSCQQGNIYVLAQTPAFLIYQIECSNNRFEIGKIFNGIDALYLVKYVTTKNAVSKNEMNQMSQVIKSAILMSNPRTRY